MPTIQPLTMEQSPAETQATLKGLEQKLGMVPNIFKTFAHSPAVLEAYMGFSGAMAKSQLSAQLREQIALTIAGKNHCDYCASAHTAIGKGTGLAESELSDSLLGKSTDAKTQKALDFVGKVVETRGHIPAGDVEVLKQAGYAEGEILEMIALVGLNLFTNYFNHIVDTEVDFPRVDTTKVPAMA